MIEWATIAVVNMTVAASHARNVFAEEYSADPRSRRHELYARYLANGTRCDPKQSARGNFGYWLRRNHHAEFERLFALDCAKKARSTRIPIDTRMTTMPDTLTIPPDFAELIENLENETIEMRRRATDDKLNANLRKFFDEEASKVSAWTKFLRDVQEFHG